MPHYKKEAERDKDEIAKDEGTLHVSADIWKCGTEDESAYLIAL